MKPKLPTYSDQETAVFHPAFEYALNEALKLKGLEHIEVKKEYPSPTGPVDLVLFNKNSQKVIMPIEIKRTQSSVRGGGRRQARDYWLNLGSQCETNFYCVSNLELIELFRHDDLRPKTSAQQVELKFPLIGDLTKQNDENLFYKKLIQSLIELLDIVLGEKSYNYSVGLPELQDNLESSLHDMRIWHGLLLPACYEYIRGAATRVDNLKQYKWKPAGFYAKAPRRLIDFGRRVDFEHIFKDPAPLPSDNIAFSSNVLTEAYKAGEALGAGDDIAELVNEVLADCIPKKLGIVETDPELAELLSVIAKVTLGRDLGMEECIIDPASGSGGLLTVLNRIAFKELSAKQLKAIEKETFFSEVLSLRLGLAFGSTISPSNSPSIIIDGIETVEKSFFDDVKVVVMNPPYISGVRSRDEKVIFAERIYEISRKRSKLNVGQAALELLFLELLCALVPDGTVITVIFPSNHLYRESQEMTAFRKYLLEDFGLRYIVTYPREGLFSDVVKGTVILSGVKGEKVEKVTLVEVLEKVSDVQLVEFYGFLLNAKICFQSNLSSKYVSGIDASLKQISLESLKASVDLGWQGVGAGSRCSDFIDSYMASFKKIDPGNIKRGTFGNKGNNKLTVINKTGRNYQLPTIIAKIPESWKYPLLNRTENMPRLLTSETAPDYSFVPVEAAYNSGTEEFVILESIIDEYLTLNLSSSGVQARVVPDREHVIKSLVSNGKNKFMNSVMVPRGSRVKGEIGLIGSEETLISTNIILIGMETEIETKLVGAWFLSIFGQLQLEFHGVSQEGMRKLEVNTVARVRYPDLTKIKRNQANKLIQLFLEEESIFFKDIKIREIDRVWAEIVFPEEPDVLLSEAFDIFQELVDYRIGLG